MSQNERILKYMKQGCARLSERVRELERTGHRIDRERVKRNGKTWTAYRLAA